MSNAALPVDSSADPPSFKQIGARKGAEVSKPKKWNHPNYKWRVDWVEGGQYKRKGFKTKTKAEEWAEGREEELREHGTQAANLTPAERAAVVEMREELREVGLTVREALEIAITLRRRSMRSCTVAELVERAISDRERSGKSPSHIRDLRSKLGSFSKAFGMRSVASISAEEIGDWLHGLNVAPASVNSYRRILVVAFNDAIRNGYLEKNENPAEKAMKSKEEETEVGILTPEDALALLTAADQSILGAVAIGLFTGLRMAELERLDWSEVSLEHGRVRVRASKAKAARNRAIPISENLRTWITPHVKASGPVWPVNGRKIMEAARLGAGFGTPGQVEKSIKANRENPEKPILKPWPDNALRHSFATYHLLHHENAEALALLLGHTSTALIFAHYRNADATASAAATFWNIGPDAPGNVVSMTKAS